MMGVLSRANVRYLLQTGGLFVVYYACALFGLSLEPVSDFASLVWPPSGIALAAVLLWGYRVFPAVLLGAFFANLTMGALPPAALAIGVGNSLECLIGAYLLRLADFENAFARLRDALSFIIFAVFLSTTVSASVGVGALYFSDLVAAGDVGSTWMAWWVGDAIGALLFTPLLLITFSKPFRLRVERRKGVEVSILFAILIALNVAAFWGPFTYVGGIPLLYFLPIPLMWSTLRFGPKGKSFAIFVTAAIATAATVAGMGPFAVLGSEQGLLLSQMFIGALATVFLLFAATVEERKRAVMALEEYIEKLESAVRKISSEDQAKNEFLAILAHELRNPLSPIMSSLELIKLNGAEPGITRFVSIIDDQVQNMSRLLDDLLDISRISRKKITLKKELLDVRTAVAKALEVVEPLMHSKGHTVLSALSARPLWVSADPLRLEQIFINLLNNAGKYTNPGGRIEISAQEKGGEVVVAVRDNGIGIEARMLPKIFEPFLQVPAHERGGNREGGLGIGLSLTKRLIELHGGSIEARSDGVGRGSEFSVRLPLEREVQNQLAMPYAASQKSSLISGAPKRRVLVVDDNVPAAEGLAKLLEHRGHEARLAFDGASALDIFRVYKPEAVILDLGLPDQSGFEVARAMRSGDPEVSLIAVTGYGQSEDKLKTRNAGFRHHLIKPVGIAEVERALSS